MTIEIELPEGGTPYGITTIEAWANNCQRRVALSSHGISYAVPLLTGTLVHAFLEYYYVHGYYEPDEVVFPNLDYNYPNTEACLLKAERVFRAYRLQFKGDAADLGTVHMVEAPFEITDPKVIGIAPFTGRIDLVVRVTKRAAKRIARERRIDLEPGLYIVDHKTAGRIYRNTIEKYSYSIQLAAYQLAFAHAYGKKPKGALVNLMTTTKDPSFQTVVVDPPSKLAKMRMASTINKISVWPPNLDESEANNSRCFDYNQPCPHWVSGACMGY